MQKLLLITYIPSPYQVEFFNAIAQSTKYELQVAYLYPNCDIPIAKDWQQQSLEHSNIVLNDSPSNYQKLEQDLEQSDLVIFNYYQHPRVASLINRCIKLIKPWCFWGERPGCKHSGFLGWLYRYWKLGQLHRSNTAIWGVGNWGIRQYQKEFGRNRSYYNLPYFSDLTRFANSRSKVENPQRTKRVFLFSGALIKRKGVDLLASAFCRLAKDLNYVALHFLGDGELRYQLEQQLAPYKNQVQFLGFQPWSKLPHYYAQADILCVPSRYDGWGLVVPEGLAAGLPVIGTNRTGAAIDLVQAGYNGWLINADQEESLYQAMYEAAILETGELAKYDQAARDRVQSHSLVSGVARFEQATAQTIEQSRAAKLAIEIA